MRLSPVNLMGSLSRGKLAALALALVLSGGVALWQIRETRKALPDMGEAIPFDAGFGQQVVDCSKPLKELQVRGATQLDATALLHDAPLLEGKPFEMARALKLMRHVREKYRQAGKAEPVLSLRLESVCDGILAVAVMETDALPERGLQENLRIARAEAAGVEVPLAQGRGGLGDLLDSVASLIYDGAARARRTMTLLTGRGFESEQRGTGGGGSIGMGRGTAPQAYVSPLPGVVQPTLMSDPWGDGLADTTRTPLGKDAVERAEDDMLFLELMLNGRRVVETITAYVDRDNPGHVWLPLGAMVKALDFPIAVDPGAGVAEGWFLTEDNTFQLNLRTRNMMLNGKAAPYPQGKAEAHTDDIYVHSSIMASWFPLDLVLDFNELRLLATSKVRLPVEERIAREKAWEDLERSKRSAAQAALIAEAQVLPYKLATMPTLRLGGNVGIRGGPNSGRNWNGGLSVQAEGDMLYSTGNLTLSGERSSSDGKIRLSGANLSLRRQELSPTLLGPLRASNILAGDIDAAALPLSSVGTQGRGLRVNNRPFGFVDDPDRFVITGNAPVGWDVEVYQNQSLLAFQRVSGDGRYRFEALPLRTGINLFRVVQYGPHGEKRESVERYTIGEEMLAPGQTVYDVAAYQPGENLIYSRGKTSTTEPWLVTTRFDYGISKYLSANMGTYGLLQTGGTPDAKSGQGMTAGVRGSYKAIFAKTDVMAGTAGERAAGFSVRAGLTDSTDVRAGYTTRSGFNTEDEPVTDVYELDLSHQQTLGRVGMQNSIGYSRREFYDGQHDHNLNQRTGLNYARWALTNTLTRTWQDDGGDAFYHGDAELSTAVESLRLRGQVSYRPMEDQLVQKMGVGAQAPLAERVQLDSTLMHTPGDEAVTELTNTLRYDVGKFSLGVQGHGSTSGDYGVGLTFNTILLPQQGGDYKLAHPSYGSQVGRATVRVFVDNNGNGLFDKGEKLLPGVDVRNRSRGTSHRTDASGIAVVDNLPSYSPVRLTLDDETMPDIYLRPAKDQLVLLSHPGGNGTMDYPVKLYGEVAGILKVGERRVGQLTVELINSRGKVEDYAVSEEDGFFAMSPLPLGTYTLRLKAEEGTKTGYALEAAPTVTLTPEQNVMEEMKVELRQLGLPAGSEVSASSSMRSGVEVVE